MQMRVLLLYLLILIPVSSFAQKIKPQKVAKLPSQIDESSGLGVADSNRLWTLNDAGGKNELFLLDFKGALLRTLLLSDFSNHDWEDLATDSSFLFIGDFGNNSNLRESLLVYKIAKSDMEDSDHLIPQTISFKYPDQRYFPPPPSNWNFDCEAFFHQGDSVYLFSKNLSNPNDGYTKMYRLPDSPWDYTAELIDSEARNSPDRTDRLFHVSSLSYVQQPTKPAVLAQP